MEHLEGSSLIGFGFKFLFFNLYLIVASYFVKNLSNGYKGYAHLFSDLEGCFISISEFDYPLLFFFFTQEHYSIRYGNSFKRKNLTYMVP